jgi:2-polyprenyl-6-methoxyphenol hydroxylase-like FAD-dependent oxidoreductase
MKALVVGAGVGGPAVALFLSRLGWDVEVVETAPRKDSSAGAFLNVATNGMAVLAELGVSQRLLSDAHPCPELVMWSGRGKQLGVVPNGPAHDPSRGGVVVRRGWLHEVLRAAVEDVGIPVRYDSHVSSVRDRRDGAVAVTRDGRELAADLIVGCDGIGSAVRRHVAADAPAPQYSGLIGLGGCARVPGLPATPGRQHFVFGHRSFFGYLVRDDGQVYWFANLTRPEPEPGTLRATSGRQWLTELEALHREDCPPVPDILAAADDGAISCYPIYDLPHVPRWQRGRVVCIGDAVHATSPSAGQGAAMTLEDAEALGRCLRDLPTVPTALARFQQIRAHRTEAIVDHARRISRRKQTTPNKAAMVLRDLMLPIFLRRAAGDTTQNWLYDHPSRWQEPITAEPAPL